MNAAALGLLTAQLIRHEGIRLKPYVDTVGKTTIGIGRNLDDVGISGEEAADMLDHDIARVEKEIEEWFPWAETLNDARQAVLMNMAFNMGIRGLSGFVQTLDAIESGRYGLAAEHMMASKWARQVGTRAMELAEQMRTGRWK